MTIYKIDSDITGLRIAKEDSLKVLPTTPIWVAYEPNSYSDFGAKVTSISRETINPSRQRKFGGVTNIDVTAGFTMDLTQSNHIDLFEGFFFADKIAQINANPSAVTATTFTVSNSTSFKANHLIYCHGFTNAGNNGLKKIISIANGKLTVASAVAETTPPADANVEVVGHEFTASKMDVKLSGNIPYLKIDSTATDKFTDLSLSAGDWIYLGSDTTSNKFANNSGFARIKTISDFELYFDKTSWTPVTEIGNAKSIRLFCGTIIKNRIGDDIKRKTFQFERTLGKDADGTQSQYVLGVIANELTINFKQSDKITLDMTFVGCDNETRSGSTAPKSDSGTKKSIVDGKILNTSNDFHRIAISKIDTSKSVADPLCIYTTDLSLKISNNLSPNKALGTLGNVDISAGDFHVDGNITAYFTEISAIEAVRNNVKVTLDAIIYSDNSGILFDVPLINIGNAQPAIEKNKEITIPLDIVATESEYHHTLLYSNFAYLPSAAGN